VIKSKRKRWVEHMACMRDSRVAYTVLVGVSSRKGDHLNDPGIDERIILKWIFSK
jgi:hypothetical protein